MPSTTGFTIGVPHGLELLDTADTVIVPGFHSLLDPPPGTLEALRCAALPLGPWADFVG